VPVRCRRGQINRIYALAVLATAAVMRRHDRMRTVWAQIVDSADERGGMSLSGVSRVQPGAGPAEMNPGDRARSSRASRHAPHPPRVVHPR